MNNYIEIKEYIKESNGIYSYSNLKEKGVSRFFIQKLIDDKILEKYERGIYVRTDIFEDIYYIMQLKYKNIYFSYNTALYFLNETEKTPSIIELTTYNGNNTSTFNKDVKVYYVSKENLELGAIDIKTPMGFYVKSYNLERTLCDIIRTNDSELDKEQTNKVIRNMILKNKIDSILLIKYAKKLKCEEKVRNILEVLI